MSGDDIGLLQRLAQQLGRLGGDEVVAGAMHAITANPMLVIQLVGQCVAEGGRRHGLVESRIEHQHVRQGGKQTAGSPDAQQVRRVMERGQRNAFFDDRFDFIGD